MTITEDAISEPTAEVDLTKQNYVVSNNFGNLKKNEKKNKDRISSNDAYMLVYRLKKESVIKEEPKIPEVLQKRIEQENNVLYEEISKYGIKLKQEKEKRKVQQEVYRNILKKAITKDSDGKQPIQAFRENRFLNFFF